MMKELLEVVKISATLVGILLFFYGMYVLMSSMSMNRLLREEKKRQHKKQGNGG